MFDPVASRRTVFDLVSAAAKRLQVGDTDNNCVCGDSFIAHPPTRMSVWLGPSGKHNNTMPTYVRRACSICDCTVYERDAGGF